VERISDNSPIFYDPSSELNQKGTDQEQPSGPSSESSPTSLDPAALQAVMEHPSSAPPPSDESGHPGTLFESFEQPEMLSEGKRSYMAEAVNVKDLSTLAQTLTSDEVELNCRRYEKSHNISIRVNGKGGGLADTELDPMSVLYDLAAIAKTAQDQKKSIGYVATGDRQGWTEMPIFRTGKVHTEALIATKSGDILNITPGTFANWMSAVQELNCNYFMSALDLLTNEPIKPQADESQCGALSLSFLKEYLKNDARNLNYALLIKNDKEESGIGFLLPPPHVLRYSQSSRYIEVLETMVFSDEKTVDHQHEGKETKVPTLRGLLESDSTQVMTVNREPFTQGDLNKYRHAWREVLDHIVKPKWQLMNLIREDGTKRNLHLSYNTQRLKAKSANRV
jgi:hypothetical protein